jgi:hypothetical protein
VLGAGKREEKKAGDADEAASTASIGAFIGSPAQHRRAPPGK